MKLFSEKIFLSKKSTTKFNQSIFYQKLRKLQPGLNSFRKKFRFCFCFHQKIYHKINFLVQSSEVFGMRINRKKNELVKSRQKWPKMHMSKKFCQKWSGL